MSGSDFYYQFNAEANLNANMANNKSSFKSVDQWFILQNEISRWAMIVALWVIVPTSLYYFSLESKWEEINKVAKKREALEESGKKKFDQVRGDDARIVYSDQITDTNKIASKIRSLVGYDKNYTDWFEENHIKKGGLAK